MVGSGSEKKVRIRPDPDPQHCCSQWGTVFPGTGARVFARPDTFSTSGQQASAASLLIYTSTLRSGGKPCGEEQGCNNNTYVLRPLQQS